MYLDTIEKGRPFLNQYRLCYYCLFTLGRLCVLQLGPAGHDSETPKHRGAILEATLALKSVKSAIFLILCVVQLHTATSTLCKDILCMGPETTK